MRKTIDTLLARAEASPHKILGFACGIAGPLIIVALIWAQTSGGLAGPRIDPRPPAFSVPTD